MKIHKKKYNKEYLSESFFDDFDDIEDEVEETPEEVGDGEGNGAEDVEELSYDSNIFNSGTPERDKNEAYVNYKDKYLSSEYNVKAIENGWYDSTSSLQKRYINFIGFVKKYFGNSTKFVKSKFEYEHAGKSDAVCFLDVNLCAYIYAPSKVVFNKAFFEDMESYEDSDAYEGSLPMNVFSFEELKCNEFSIEGLAGFNGFNERFFYALLPISKGIKINFNNCSFDGISNMPRIDATEIEAKGGNVNFRDYIISFDKDCKFLNYDVIYDMYKPLSKFYKFDFTYKMFNIKFVRSFFEKYHPDYTRVNEKEYDSLVKRNDPSAKCYCIKPIPMRNCKELCEDFVIGVYSGGDDFEITIDESVELSELQKIHTIVRPSINYGEIVGNVAYNIGSESMSDVMSLSRIKSRKTHIDGNFKIVCSGKCDNIQVASIKNNIECDGTVSVVSASVSGKKSNASAVDNAAIAQINDVMTMATIRRGTSVDANGLEYVLDRISNSDTNCYNIKQVLKKDAFSVNVHVDTGCEVVLNNEFFDAMENAGFGINYVEGDVRVELQTGCSKFPQLPSYINGNLDVFYNCSLPYREVMTFMSKMPKHVSGTVTFTNRGDFNQRAINVFNNYINSDEWKNKNEKMANNMSESYSRNRMESEIRKRMRLGANYIASLNESAVLEGMGSDILKRIMRENKHKAYLWSDKDDDYERDANKNKIRVDDVPQNSDILQALSKSLTEIGVEWDKIDDSIVAEYEDWSKIKSQITASRDVVKNTGGDVKYMRILISFDYNYTITSVIYGDKFVYEDDRFFKGDANVSNRMDRYRVMYNAILKDYGVSFNNFFGGNYMCNGRPVTVKDFLTALGHTFVGYLRQMTSEAYGSTKDDAPRKMETNPSFLWIQNGDFYNKELSDAEREFVDDNVNGNQKDYDVNEYRLFCDSIYNKMVKNPSNDNYNFEAKNKITPKGYYNNRYNYNFNFYQTVDLNSFVDYCDGRVGKDLKMDGTYKLYRGKNFNEGVDIDFGLNVLNPDFVGNILYAACVCPLVMDKKNGLYNIYEMNLQTIISKYASVYESIKMSPAFESLLGATLLKDNNSSKLKLTKDTAILFPDLFNRLVVISGTNHKDVTKISNSKSTTIDPKYFVTDKGDFDVTDDEAMRKDKSKVSYYDMGVEASDLKRYALEKNDDVFYKNYNHRLQRERLRGMQDKRKLNKILPDKYMNNDFGRFIKGEFDNVDEYPYNYMKNFKDSYADLVKEIVSSLNELKNITKNYTEMCIREDAHRWKIKSFEKVSDMVDDIVYRLRAASHNCMFLKDVRSRSTSLMIGENRVKHPSYYLRRGDVMNLGIWTSVYLNTFILYVKDLFFADNEADETLSMKEIKNMYMYFEDSLKKE